MTGRGGIPGVDSRSAVAALLLACAFAPAVLRAGAPRDVSRGAQVPFARVVEDLGSRDPAARLRAVRLLRDAAYPEAAAPLAAALTDADPTVRLEAIAAELNIFLAEKIVARRRVGLVIEVRHPISAEAVFSQGPLAVGPEPVPAPVFAALLQAAHGPNRRAALEALYAFGTLAVEPSGARRRDLLTRSAPELAAMLGSPDPAYRFAALRVAERIFERRAGDEAIDPVLGDPLVGALNDRDRTVRAAAMAALGAARYDRAVAALTEQFQFFRRGPLAEAALGALARIAHPASRPIFAEASRAKDEGLKLPAIEGLVRLGGADALDLITAALVRVRDERVALAGAFAAARLSGAPLDALVEALRRPRLAVQALQYLAEIAPARPGAFGRYAQDPDPKIRASVADLLGLGGDRAALSIVESLRRDPDPRVALAAERATARLTP